jgi:protein TonB
VQVHVQAGTASKGAGDTNNQIVNAAAGGPIGQVPTGPSSGTITGGPSGQPVQAPVIVSAPAIEPPITPPVVTPPPVPKSDVVVEAEPTYQPEPVIPDNLLDSDIDTTFYAYFTVQPDGSIDVKMVQGTGNSILDRLAMDAARQWKFAPATKNGVPVLSYRRLQVQFVVS